MKTLLLAAGLAAASFAAPAADLSYTYVEGGYARLHADDADLGDPELDGGYLRGSLDLGSGFNLIGGVSRASEEFALDPRLGFDLQLDLDVTQYELGAGYRMAMSDRVDFLAELAWVRVDVDAEVAGQGADDHFNGGRGAVGVRGAFNDVVEGVLKANYYDGGDFDGGFTGVLGAQFRVTPTWGITAEVEHGELLLSDEDTRYTLGVRANF